MPLPFIMPKFDMDQEKATIITWLKHEGDEIKLDEAVLVVETEKVAIEVPAPASGKLVGICFKEGDVVPIATVIAYVLKKGETLSDLPAGASPAAAVVVETQNPVAASALPSDRSATPIAVRMASEAGIDLSQVPSTGGRITREDVESYLASVSDKRPALEVKPSLGLDGKVLATPAARHLARQGSIPLESIAGSGPNGRVQAQDVRAASAVVSDKKPALEAQSAPLANVKEGSGERPAQIIPLVGMRLKIAQKLQASFQESPHIAETVEVDVTRLEELRANLNAIAAREKTGKISMTVLLVKIVSWALQRNPYVNSSLLDNSIYLWQDVNVGVATALENGLIVPVIHNSNKMTVRQLGDSLADLSLRAREGRLGLSDVQRGTFTISNLGMYGIRQFRAVINPPESAILAVGAVVRKPVVVDEHDTVAVRPIMSLTISADHRIIDGVVAARFLADLVQGIEYPEVLL